MVMRQRLLGSGVAGVLLVVAIGGCGPSKTRPKEADLSGVPGPVVEQFRRDFPNDIVLSTREEKGEEGATEWEIYHYTPLAKEKSTWYSVEGVKLRGW